jgi:ribosome biogenesis GTPase
MIRDYSNFLPLSGTFGGPKNAPSTLKTLGWQAWFSQQTSVDELEATPPVRVVDVQRSGLHVKGDGIDDVIPPRQDATVGDWFLFDREQPKESRLLDRKSLIKRRAAGTGRHVQLIAANVDTVFIVTSCNQDFNVARLERYIALALEAGVTPVIVLTKTDLCDDPEPYVEAARAISHRVPVVALDARGGQPKTVLAEWCTPGQTVAFLGSSGVGKSTLTNALSGKNLIETQSIREDDAKGRHTTTSRHLYILPDGCAVLDTPGMRELQLADAAAGVGDLFSDLEDLAGQCKFSDCQHQSEPGCAITEAIEAGDIDPQRLKRWQKLVAEEKFNSASLAERRLKERSFGKMVRLAQKQKKNRS